MGKEDGREGGLKREREGGKERQVKGDYQNCGEGKGGTVVRMRGGEREKEGNGV